jgi:nicotinamidase/pyrazinamidase
MRAVHNRSVKVVFFDVDTQIDFLFPAGALAVPGAQKILNQLSALTRFAITKGIQIISTADAHSENDPEFKDWPPHCVAGTVGQQKVSTTFAGKPLVLSTDPAALESVRERIAGASQILIEKQKLDAFTNPNLRPLLDIVRADRYVVYGVVTEHCVQSSAFGLLNTGARVELVTDAIKSLNTAAERDVLERFQAHGGVFTTTAAATAERVATSV